ncbi:iron-sulfur cluster assembly scaffold protein [Candidatus Bipolaricaulota bacterium]
MEAEFDRHVENRQHETVRELQRVYSDTVVDRFFSPKNLGRLAEPDAYGIVHGWCGDTMEIYLRLVEDRVRTARFMTDGCGATVACGSMLSTMVTGLTLKEALRIRPYHLIDALDGLPDDNAHCAKLAVDTLMEAIRNRLHRDLEHLRQPLLPE